MSQPIQPTIPRAVWIGGGIVAALIVGLFGCLMFMSVGVGLAFKVHDAHQQGIDEQPKIVPQTMTAPVPPPTPPVVKKAEANIEPKDRPKKVDHKVEQKKEF